MRIGTKVRLTKTARDETYADMSWKNDTMIITHKHDEHGDIGCLYSFDNLSDPKDEITCSMYSYELRKV